MKHKGNSVLWIALLIIASFSITTLISVNSLSSVMDSQKEYTMRLMSGNIHNAIDSKMAANIAISRTMSKNSSVADLLFKDSKVEEKVREGNIKETLSKLQVGMGLDYSFVVSDATKRVYTSNGFSRTIDPSVDLWYNECATNSKDYVVTIKGDGQEHKNLAVYINSPIRDGNNNLLGVTGMAVDVTSLQNLLQSLEQEYGVLAYLVDDEGYVLVASDNSKIGNILSLDYKVSTDSGKYRYENTEINGEQRYFISRYLANLGWYLVVVDNDMVIKDVSSSLIGQNIVAAIVVLLIVLVITQRLVVKDRKKLEVTAYRDKLTGLYNRNYVKILMNGKVNLDTKRFKALAIIDVDRFKEENDTKGHLAGDSVLRNVSYIMRGTLKDDGLAIRWGGDEFIILFMVPAQIAAQLCEEMRHRVEAETDVTISVGVSGLKPRDTLTAAVERADSGLYKVKEAGRNKVFLVK